MRKNLHKKFWSHGTPLGSLGPLSQQDTILGAGQLQILVIWGPYRPPIVVAFETQAENPKTAGVQCGLLIFCSKSQLLFYKKLSAPCVQNQLLCFWFRKLSDLNFTVVV